MNIEITEGGWYIIHVDRETLSVYMSWTLSNDVIGTDGEIQYIYRHPRSPFSDRPRGYKVNQLVSVGTVGGGGGGGDETSLSDTPVLFGSTPDPEPQDEVSPTTYSFALDGRRVGKAGVADLKYLYDGENVIYELWSYSTVRFVHPVSSKTCSGGCGCGNSASAFTDHPISITIDGMKYYYLYDGLGSVTELIDEDENVVNVYRYTPFGEALVKEENVYNPHQFTGRQYDAESGLYHYRARAYSPDVGRFMQQDPAAMVDGPNMYAYVGNNPVNQVDPTGSISYPGNINRFPSILFDGSYADRPHYTYGQYYDAYSSFNRGNDQIHWWSQSSEWCIPCYKGGLWPWGCWKYDTNKFNTCMTSQTVTGWQDTVTCAEGAAGCATACAWSLPTGAWEVCVGCLSTFCGSSVGWLTYCGLKSIYCG